VSSSFPRQFWSAWRDWWREHAEKTGAVGASSLLIKNLWIFVRESTPEQRRQRYGDMEYDWENRVNTTSGTVGWLARLLGLFHSPYQPTDPAIFAEILANLPIAVDQFTFVDVGSGKGRTLLMASEFPFHRIVGVELIEELHQAAEENIRAYLGFAQHFPQQSTQHEKRIEAVLADAREFEFPDGPLVLYLFNPLPELALTETLGRLEQSLIREPRPVWIVYHTPMHEAALRACRFLEKVSSTPQYSLYKTVGLGERVQR
jgi:hypothetical protein